MNIPDDAPFHLSRIDSQDQATHSVAIDRT